MSKTNEISIVEHVMFGHNNPPSEPTPFDQSRDEIEGLYAEAKNWLDGEPIETQSQADEIGKLIDGLRKASKTADARRIAENEPFDKGKTEVQTRYNPLIQKDKGKADIAISTCRKALVPFLEKQEAAKRAEADLARKEADEARRKAEDAFRASNVADLAERERAEALLKNAKDAEKYATQAEKDKGKVAGGARAVTLRTEYIAEVNDVTAFSRYVWQFHREELSEWMKGFAQQLVDGKARDIDGVSITERKFAI